MKIFSINLSTLVDIAWVLYYSGGSDQWKDKRSSGGS